MSNLYRYVFNPTTCAWEIQILQWGFFWKTLRCIDFETLECAVDFAGAVGLTAHYQEKRPFNHPTSEVTQ